jgi:MerR family transcriptional regulator, aldehyde-responsive regulator
MTIQEVAEATGISAYTIRFYEKCGILPPIQRTESGIRHFTEADIRFLRFLLELKRTGMSLEEIAEFTADGCLLERIQRNEFSAQPVERRLAILRQHKQRLHEQRRQLDMVLDAVHQKIGFYEHYLRNQRSETAEL